VRAFSLQWKTTLFMGVAMSIALAVSLAAVSRVYGSIRELDRIGRDNFQAQLALADAATALERQGGAWKDVLLHAREPEVLEGHWARFVTQEQGVVSSVREARASVDDPDLAKLLDQFLEAESAA